MTEVVRRHIQVARMKAAYVSNYSGWEVLEDGMECDAFVLANEAVPSLAEIANAACSLVEELGQRPTHWSNESMRRYKLLRATLSGGERKEGEA